MQHIKACNPASWINSSYRCLENNIVLSYFKPDSVLYIISDSIPKNHYFILPEKPSCTTGTNQVQYIEWIGAVNPVNSITPKTRTVLLKQNLLYLFWLCIIFKQLAATKVKSTFLLLMKLLSVIDRWAFCIICTDRHLRDSNMLIGAGEQTAVRL